MPATGCDHDDLTSNASGVADTNIGMTVHQTVQRERQHGRSNLEGD
ncbi:hypothetical protein [Bradyrhizobium liaoningense]|nr:hypothetical protein [Bradyrhizobium liaoningense]